MNNKTSYIIDAVRTPIGRFGGSLSTIRTDDLAAIVIKNLMDRIKIDSTKIDEVILGCANQAGEDNRNIARMALLLAGLPYTVPGETVNRLCASGMSAVIHAHRAIQVGDGNIYLAGGVENMTRGPWVISKASSPFGRDVEMHDTSFGWRFINSKLNEKYGTESMGKTAENLVEKFGISRQDQDEYAFNSQMKATHAQINGRFDDEMISVKIPQRKADSIIFNHDEFIKSKTTVNDLSKLKSVFKADGTVTAGNSSGLNDGAAIMLMASEKAISNEGFIPISRIVSSAVVGVEPKIMGIGPVEASNKALKRAGLKMSDMDIIEINEAFAAQSLACIRKWGLDDDDPRINPNGGAIALGHPLGMSGTRILQTASLELKKQNKSLALVTMCIGVGQGYAVIIERL